MPFTAGPIVIEALPLGPRVSLPFAFEALAADVAFTGSAIDTALATHARTLAPFVDLDVDPAFADTLAGALEGLDTIAPAGDDVDLGDIAAVIDSVVDDIATQALDLPGPDEAEPTGATPPADGDPGVVHLQGDAPEPAPGPAPLPAPEPGPAPGPEPGPGPALTPEQQVRAAIRGLYLELLHREPDPAGWDTWTAAVLVRGQSLESVRAAFVASPEFRLLHGG